MQAFITCIIQSKHGSKSPLPSTHNRNTTGTPIDAIFTNLPTTDAIQCGYFGFENGFIGCHPIQENREKILLEGFSWRGGEPSLRLEMISVRESNRVLRRVDGNQPTVMSFSSRNTDRCPAAQTRRVAGKTVKTWKCLRHQGNSCTPILERTGRRNLGIVACPSFGRDNANATS